MTVRIYPNTSRPAAVQMPSSQTLAGWPWTVIQASHLEQTAQTVLGFAPITKYTNHVRSDFFAPLVDLDADGKSDIALVKASSKLMVAPGTTGAEPMLYRFVPRVYLSRGSPLQQFELDSWNASVSSDFSRSLAEIVNAGQPDPCKGQQCDRTSRYPPSRNFNTFFADLNADGLPDLIVASPPSAIGAPDPARRVCVEGHSVFLNRGYRWEAPTAKVLAAETWSSTGDISTALGLLRNREPRCGAGPDLRDGLGVGWRAPMSTMAMADLNADGRVDMLIAYRTGGQGGGLFQRAFLNTGRGFAPAPAGKIVLPDGFAVAQYEDASAHASLDANPRWPDIGRIVDVDGDGLVDLLEAGVCQQSTTGSGGFFAGGSNVVCQSAKWYRNRGVVPDLLTQLETSSGSWTQVTYVAAASPAAAGQSVLVDRGQVHAGQLVVRLIERAAGRASAGFDVESISFEYRNFVRDVATTDTIGFEQVTARFQNRFAGTLREQVLLSRTFDVRELIAPAAVRYPLRGMPVSVIVESDGYRIETRSTYRIAAQGSGAQIRFSAEHTAHCLGASCLWIGTDVVGQDSFGFPTKTREGVSTGTAIVPDGEMRTTIRSYDHKTSSVWRLGLIASELVTGYTESLSGVGSQGNVLLNRTRTFDSLGQLATETRSLGANGSCPGAATADVRSYDYDLNASGLGTGLLKKTTHIGKNVHELFYDPLALYVSGETTTVSRYRNGQLSGTSTLTTTYGVDLRHGKVSRAVDLNGGVVTTSYDSWGRKLELRGPGGVLLEEASYQDSFPVSVTRRIHTDSDLAYSRKVHLDGNGETLGIVEEDNTGFLRTSRLRRDAFGRAIEQYLGKATTSLDGYVLATEAAVTASQFDGFDRPVEIVRPGGFTTRFAYLPRKVTETNPRGFKTEHTVNSRGRLVHVRRLGALDQQIAAHTIRRDGLDEIIGVTDADGAERHFERDSGGRVRRFDLPHALPAAAAVLQVCYDQDDQPIRIQTPHGRVIDLVRDELGRIVQLTATDGAVTDTVTHEYDEVTGNGMGRLVNAADASGRYAFSYDAFDRRSRTAYRPAPELAALLPNPQTEWTTETVYNYLGAIRSIRVSGPVAAITTSYERDARGRTRRVVGVGPPNHVLSEAMVYDGQDRLVEAHLGNGTTAKRSYDAITERLTLAQHLDAAGTPLRTLAYAYDANANLLTETNTGPGTTAVASKEHTYDALDRLASSKLTTTLEQRSDVFTYSPGGNLKQAGTEIYSYQNASLSQAATSIIAGQSSRSLTYDADGQLTKDELTSGSALVEQRTLTYRPNGCLASVAAVRQNGNAPSQFTTHLYCDRNGDNVARVTRDTAGTVVEARISLGDIAELRPRDGLLIIRLPLGDSTFLEDARDVGTGQRVDAQSAYLHTDPRGSVVATTSFTAPGATVVAESEYDAWGASVNVSSRPRPRHGLADADVDSYLGYYHFGPRTYDPTLRRWLTVDPLLAKRPELDEQLGEELNLYAYARNNPVRWSDPSGVWVLAAVGVALVVVGFATILASDDAQRQREAHPEAAKDPVKGVALSVGLIGAAAGAPAAVSPLAAGGRAAPVMQGEQQAAKAGAEKVVEKTGQTAANQAAKDPAFARRMSETFGKGRGGTEQVLKEIREGTHKPASGLTRGDLLRYKDVAQKALERYNNNPLDVGKAEQLRRLEIIEKLLKKMGEHN